MSTAASVLPEMLTPPATAAYPPVSESSLLNLVHELRQPLSAMESIAYYLELTIPAEQAQARRQIARLQQLVVEASDALSEAVRQSRTSD